MEHLSIASAQIELIENDYRGNMGRAAAMTAAIAAGSTAGALLFPELCIEGNDFADYAQNLSDRKLEEIDDFWRGLARNHGKHIVTGKVCRREGLLYDCAVCYTPEGEILAQYDKAHLYDGERKVFVAGDSFVIMELAGFRLGLLVCADLGFPEFSRAMAGSGVDAFLAISSWCRPYEDLWRLCCRARAAENTCWLVACNRLGVEPTGRYNCGCSVAVAPSGKVVADLADRQNRYFTVDIRREDISQQRQEVRWLEWLRPELYSSQTQDKFKSRHLTTGYSRFASAIFLRQ